MAECCSDEGKRREAFCSDVDCDAGLREEASAPPRERFDAVATPLARKHFKFLRGLDEAYFSREIDEGGDFPHYL